MIENMKVEFGRTSDIDSWMQLVRKVSWNFSVYFVNSVIVLFPCC
jgi:hypothetical protein